jgi:hypothetical protein
VETPRKFITAKLSIRKPGPSSVLIICIITDEDPGLRIESFAVINLRGVSQTKSILCFITMQAYKSFIFYLLEQLIASLLASSTLLQDGQ